MPSSKRATSPRRCGCCSRAQPALVLSDLRLPEGDGFGVLRASKEIDPDVPVIVMTAYGSIEDAVAAMKEGALDFLAKPVDPDHLLLLVARALEQRRHGDREPPAEGGARGAPRRAAARRRGSVAAQGVRRRCSARRRPTRPCCSRARAAPARSCSRDRCTRSARAPTRRLSRSTARRFPRRCSRPSCSATRRARSPAPWRASPASSRWRIAARCSSTRSAICRWRCRPRSCARSRSGGSSGSAARRSVQVDVRLVAATNRGLQRGGRGAAVPRGSVLPAVGVSDHGSAAARARRRHPAAGALLRRALLPRPEEAAAGAVAGGARAAAGLSLAGQRARAAELHRARGDPRRRRHDPAAPPEPVVRRRRQRRAAAQPVGADRSVGHAGRRDAARRRRGRAAEDRDGAAARPTATRAAPRSCCRSATRCCSRSCKEHRLE